MATTIKQLESTIAEMEKRILKLQAEMLELKATRNKPSARREPSPAAKAYAMVKWLNGRKFVSVKQFRYFPERNYEIRALSPETGKWHPPKPEWLEEARQALGF